MPNRYFSSAAYRYGFNGMEKDDEVKGSTGSSYTTYFRQYDPRLGRWMSMDPVNYPWQSDYAAFNNNPIYFADPSGAEGVNSTGDNPDGVEGDGDKGGKADDSEGKKGGGETTYGEKNEKYISQIPRPDLTSTPKETKRTFAKVLSKISGKGFSFNVGIQGTEEYPLISSFASNLNVNYYGTDISGLKRLTEPNYFMFLHRNSGKFPLAISLLKLKTSEFDNGVKLEASSPFGIGVTHKLNEFSLSRFLKIRTTFVITIGPTISRIRLQEGDERSIKPFLPLLKTGFSLTGYGGTAFVKVDADLPYLFGLFVVFGANQYVGRAFEIETPNQNQTETFRANMTAGFITFGGSLRFGGGKTGK